MIRSLFFTLFGVAAGLSIYGLMAEPELRRTFEANFLEVLGYPLGHRENVLEEISLEMSPKDNEIVSTSSFLNKATGTTILAAPRTSKPKTASVKKQGIVISTTSSTEIKKIATASKKEKTPCAWKTLGLPSRDVLINEIAWMGGEDDPDSEWLELKNVSGMELSLADWELRSKSGKVDLYMTGILAPGGLYVIGTSPEDADWSVDRKDNIQLSNSGEWLKLFNVNCGLVDEVDARHGWPGGSNYSKKTLERKVAAEGWQTSGEVGGTPGKQNTIILNLAALPTGSSESSGQVLGESSSSIPKILIIAVQTSGGTGKSENDLIKIFNAGSESVDMGGWKLRKRTKSGTESSIRTLADGTEIPGGGTFTWANSKFPEGADTTSTATLSDDNSIALLNKEDIVEDALAWGMDHLNPFVETSAYPSNPLPAQVLGRKLSNGEYVDSGNNALDFEIK